MLEQGHIKLFRGFLEWEWWHDINTSRLFIYMLLKANWKPGRFGGIDIPRGSFVSSIGELAHGANLTENEVRTAIKHLIKTGEVNKQTTNKFTVFTVKNYCLYQDAPNQITDKAQADHNQTTIKSQTINNNRRKEEKKEEKECILPPKSPQGEGQAEDLTVETAGGAAEAAIRPKTPVQGFEEFWKAFPKKASKGAALKAWNKLRPGNDLSEKIMAAIERAKKSEQWNRENGRFIPYPATWLNAQGWEDELEPQNKAKAQTTYDIEAFEQSGAFDDLDWRP